MIVEQEISHDESSVVDNNDELSTDLDCTGTDEPAKQEHQGALAQVSNILCGAFYVGLEISARLLFVMGKDWKEMYMKCLSLNEKKTYVFLFPQHLASFHFLNAWLI